MKIKERPEDFVVREIIDLNSKTPGTGYAYFLMKKKNLSTIRAIRLVARNLRISKKRIFFAGEKDKKTVSEQYIAIKGLEDFKYEYNFGNVKLKYIGSFEEPLRISDIVENEFEITIRDVKNEEMEKFEENLDIFSKYFYNYFDDQRFGNIRYINHLIGREIINRNWENAIRILLTYQSENENLTARNARKWLSENWGKFEEAIKYFPKWLDIELGILNYLIRDRNYYRAFKVIHKRLLKLFLHSYQSYIWNKVLSNYIKEFGDNLYKIKVAMEDLYISKNKDFIDRIRGKVLPAVGHDLNIEKIEDDFKRVYKEILMEEKIRLDRLYFKDKPSLTLNSINRPIIAEVSNFKYEIKDSTIRIYFKLKKGSYATILVKHLFS
ncbi:MAG: tRNA pseudouridine(13) synthase TruD [Candidatus Nanoclepta minutus]|uniref:tRNA pseudouridine(13) synthase TruD n=1 Tax=Candidatus Nanoclepta minutus TaxID=1940235 RepID=A0A397WMF0_9ARCH|nr:MAG: tRNA pseudouridine(13) synthase TruD [Candidatus Nanoclepta minutus]